MVIRLIEEQVFDPPRDVEVFSNGRWVPAKQLRWRLCDDGMGWRAEVTWQERYDWGLGKHHTIRAPDKVRLPAG